MMESSKSLVNKFFPEYDTWLDDNRVRKPCWMTHIENDNGDIYCIFDDDGRPGFSDPSWLRLKYLVENTDLFITKFFICWRKKKVQVVENPPYFFFARSVLGEWPSGRNWDYFLTGTGSESIIVKRWALPTIKIESQEERFFEDTKPEFIIWNNTSTNPVTLTKRLDLMDTL